MNTSKRRKSLLTAGVAGLVIAVTTCTFLGLSRAAPEFFSFLALGAIEDGNFDRARRLARWASKWEVESDSPELAFASSFSKPLGDAFIAGDYEQALQISAAWREATDGQDAQAFYFAGKTYCKQGQWNEATAAYTKAMGIYGRFPNKQQMDCNEILAALSDLMNQQGYPPAKRDFSRIIKQFGDAQKVSDASPGSGLEKRK